MKSMSPILAMLASLCLAIWAKSFWAYAAMFLFCFFLHSLLEVKNDDAG